MTGDGSSFVISTYGTISAATSSSGLSMTPKNSSSTPPAKATVYFNRASTAPDPTIAVTSYLTDAVHREAGDTSYTALMAAHGGANVFVYDPVACPPVCASCVHGTCTQYNTCTCATGWTGASCSVAICLTGCVSGTCTNAPGTCTCNAGFSGTLCNTCAPGFYGVSCNVPVFCVNTLFGGSFALVRHAPQGTVWHAATDKLAGSASYGTYVSSATAPAAFSVPFTLTPSTPVLFMTGDGNYYLLTNFSSVIATTGSTGGSIQPMISSSGAVPSRAIFYNRAGVAADQTIAISGVSTDTIYREGSDTTLTSLLSAHGGANVFVYDSIKCPPVCPAGCIQGACTQYNTCVCASGWTGVSCNSPICASCVNGACTAPGVCTCQSGWQGSSCNVAICSNGCVQGACNAPNTCTCNAGWSGTNCSSAICSPSCVNGLCTTPNTCTCSAGWQHALCDKPVCSLPCVNGLCLAPNVCACTVGWSGPSCTDAICSAGCQNGTCTNAPGACKCNAGYSGAKCDQTNCLDGCRYGSCTTPGTCNCYPGFFNPKCDEYIYCDHSQSGGDWALVRYVEPGLDWHVAYDNLTGIASYGVYLASPISNQSFSIAYGRYLAGDAQEFMFMTGDKSVFAITTWAQLKQTSPKPIPIIIVSSSYNPLPSTGYMLNRGPKFPTDPMISLNTTGFGDPVLYAEGNSSLHTSVLALGGFGVYIRSHALCQSICAPGCRNGYCSVPGECTCHPNYGGDLCDVCLPGWSGVNCTVAVCSDSCLHGSCNEQPGACVCDDGWTDVNCSTPICDTCVNGNCTLPDTCTCNAGWSDVNCTTAVCALGCRHGSCSQPGTCVCDDSWDGALCDAPLCTPSCMNGHCVEGAIFNAAGLVFNHACACSEGWTGIDCSTPICATDCPSSRGTCSVPGGCDCFANFNGTMCQDCSATFTGFDFA